MIGQIDLSIFLVLLLNCIVLFGLIKSKHLIETIIFFNLFESSIIVLFLKLVYRQGAKAPVISELFQNYVDPIPQALMITAIVIGTASTALSLMFSIKLYHHYGSLLWEDLERGEEE